MAARDVRARTAGVLLITATVASLVSTTFLGSLLSGSSVLAGVSQHQDRVLAAAFFQLLAAFTSAAIAVAFYPVLRPHAEGMALGAVGFRLVEGTFYALAAVGMLMLVALSGELSPGVAASAAGRTSGLLLRGLGDSAALAGILAFYVGGTLYYLVFYRSRLIPRWLSVWGLLGTTLGAVAALLLLFRMIGTLSVIQVVLNVPIGVQELVLAVWLIWRGFATPTPVLRMGGRRVSRAPAPA